MTDLTPLRDTSLRWLACSQCPITDLPPLANLRLHYLNVAGTRVTDQGSGRVLVLWRGRPAARSAAALNRCLHL